MHEVFKFHRLRSIGGGPDARPKTNFHAGRDDHPAGLLATRRQAVLSAGLLEILVAPVGEGRIQECWLDINALLDNHLEGCFIEIRITPHYR